MPISRSAKKSWRKSIKNQKINIGWKNKFKEAVKKFKDKPNQTTLNELISFIDKLGQKNIFHHNKVKRLKSKYARQIKIKTPAATKKTKKKVVK
ncbi:MAG TPA: 30S ribosomal protein S20 [Candidatus Woesebacteria bacterium]|nr:30S ribosomal protein S20 [Candidatus Woesebacteria bacterium]HRT39885.1 30S ribosomal protein S20 [Candidatus Woesebacteria bacterium]